MQTIILAAKNLQRYPFRSGALALAVALVSGILFGGGVAMKGITTSIDLGVKRLGADLMVVPAGYEDKAKATIMAGEPSTFYMPAGVLDKVRQTRGVRRASPQLFMKPSIYTCCSPVESFLVAFEPETDFTIQPWMQQALGRPLGPGEIIVGRSIPVPNGMEITFYGANLLVVGALAETGTKFIDNGIFMTFATARKMIRESATRAEKPMDITEDSISAVLVQADEGLALERAKVFIEYNVDKVKAITTQEVIGNVKEQLLALMRSLVVLGLAMWAITLGLVAVVFSMIVHSRRREIGMLRAMGARRCFVFRMIVAEAFLIAFAGGGAGILAGGGILFSIRDAISVSFNLPYLWPHPLYIAAIAATTLALALVTGILAAIFPAARSSGMEPYAAIRTGEMT